MNLNFFTILIIGVVLIAGYLTIAPKLEQAGITVPYFESSTTTPETSSDIHVGTSREFFEDSPLTNPSPPPTETIIPIAPAGFSAKDLSPHYEKIRIASVYPPPSFDNDQSEFMLWAFDAPESGISITGWRVKSNKGEVTIPLAVSDFSPFITAIERTIILKQGDYLTVRSSSKGAFGKNFRVNQCMGFLNATYQFDPAVGGWCPALYETSELVTLSGNCQSFIYSLGSCEMPSAERWSESGVSGDASCREFINRLTYAECYRRYRSTETFFTNEWRAFLNMRIPFDSSHDRILLLDSNGLLVSVYTY